MKIPNKLHTKWGTAKLYKGRYHVFNSHGRVGLHVLIWKKNFKSIPKGYEIHHIDGNRYNNSIENLICISKEAHKILHKYMEKNEYKDLEIEKISKSEAKKRFKEDNSLTYFLKEVNNYENK